MAAVTATATALVLAAAACTPIPVPPASSASPTTTHSVTPSPSADATPGGTATSPVPSPSASAERAGRGGTLRLAGGHDVDVFDFTSGLATTANLLRGVSRQLVSYRSGAFADVGRSVAADAAMAVPLPVNGTTYTFTLRPGLRWDLPTPRAVTAADFARGLKRQCNPVAPGYYAAFYTQTILGMADFCAGLRALGAAASAKQLRAYIESHDVAGLQATDDRTLVVTLAAPTGEFLNMMALTAASAVPVESLDFLPGTAALRTHLVSDGPYRVADYVPGRTMTLTRNPVWDPETDPIRHAWADEVDVDFGLDPPTAQALISDGHEDLTTDLTVPPSGPEQAADPRFEGVANGAISYAAFNLHATGAGRALAKVAVRKALALAVDKTAVVAAAGGPDDAQPLDTVLTPLIYGYKPAPPVTPGDKGDPRAARAALAAAGYPHGLALRLVYADAGANGAVAQTLAAAWRAAGVTVTTAAVIPGALPAAVSHVHAADWDIVLPLPRQPDWYPTGARSIFVPLLATGGVANYGGYSDPALDQLIDQAVAEPDSTKAADIWAQADAAAVGGQPWVPLYTGKSFFYRADRVQGLAWDALGMPDWTNVWLRGAVTATPAPSPTSAGTSPTS